MKIKLFPVMLLLVLSACSSSIKENYNDFTINKILGERADTILTEESSMNVLEQIGPCGPIKRSYEEIKKMYPDKTILTVIGISPSDFITDAVNEYLIRNGSDYVVYFKPMTEMQLSIITHANDFQKVEERKQIIYELLDIVDILPIDRNNYYEMAREGRFESWNSYLYSESGKKLYQSLPINNWKSCDVDGQIYGINNRADLVYGPPSYIVNKEIMEKYNITENDLNKPIYELEDIIKKVAEGENTNKEFRAIAQDYAICINLSCNPIGYLASSAVAFYNDLTKNADSVLNDQEYLLWLKALCKYANTGYVGRETPSLNDFFITINVHSSLPHSNPLGGRFYNKEGKLADSDDVIEIILDKFYNGCIAWNNYMMYAECIPASSRHKDEAFDFITRLYTDPYLTNLLTYGIENRTYTMTNGKVDFPFIHELTYGNTYITYPRFYEFIDKNERYWRLNDELPYTYYDFIFDPTNVREEIKNTNLVMNKVSDILTGNVKDFDAFISDIKEQLDRNGLTRLLNEVNRQRNEWIQKKQG